MGCADERSRPRVTTELPLPGEWSALRTRPAFAAGGPAAASPRPSDARLKRGEWHQEGEKRSMLDTLAVAREMTAGGIDRDQAEAIANAMRQVAEQGDHVTSDQFKAGLAEVRTEIAEVRAEIANLDTRLSAQIGDVRTEVANLDTRLSTQIAGVRTEVANLETRLIRWMVGTVLATATLTAAILRFLSGSAG